MDIVFARMNTKLTFDCPNCQQLHFSRPTLTQTMKVAETITIVRTIWSQGQKFGKGDFNDCDDEYAKCLQNGMCKCLHIKVYGSKYSPWQVL